MLVNIARYLSLDPESALRKTNRKFKRRFQWMEEQLRRPDAARIRLRWRNSSRCGSRRRNSKGLPKPAEAGTSVKRDEFDAIRSDPADQVRSP